MLNYIKTEGYYDETVYSHNLSIGLLFATVFSIPIQALYLPLAWHGINRKFNPVKKNMAQDIVYFYE